MAELNQSFRHLFSFGGASNTPAKEEPPKPELSEPLPVPAPLPRSVPVPERKHPRPSPVSEAAPQEQPHSDDLSDPEDCPQDIIMKAKEFWRKDVDIETLRHEWFEGGRQDRLRMDFKMNRKRRSKGHKLGGKPSSRKPD